MAIQWFIVPLFISIFFTVDVWQPHPTWGKYATWAGCLTLQWLLSFSNLLLCLIHEMCHCRPIVLLWFIIISHSVFFYLAYYALTTPQTAYHDTWNYYLVILMFCVIPVIFCDDSDTLSTIYSSSITVKSTNMESTHLFSLTWCIKHSVRLNLDFFRVIRPLQH